MTFTPTDEQLEVVEAAESTPNNLIISALAGAAKTTTLVLVAQALPKTQMLCLAFNKRIAEEMAKRLPKNCEARTLNSLGHRVWSEARSRRLILETDKVYKLVNTYIKAAPSQQQRDLFDRMSEIIKAVNEGKTGGYVPDGHYPNAKRLMGDDMLYNALDEEPTSAEFDIIRKVTLRSIEQGIDGTIDFNDQILLPTIFPAPFPYVPLVLVDEAQDLSSLNHATLRKLAKKRLIAVGDENQAIYAFRGANADSMPLLRDTFQMERLVLSTSFRCPQAVVREAQWRAPHMRFPDWAVEGRVERLDSWDHTTPPAGSAIICRNNAPLFSIAIKLLKNGRYPKIVGGNDIGKYLIKVMTKFGEPNMPRLQVYDAISAWANGMLAKSRDPAKVHDQVACMLIFANIGDTLGDAITYAKHLFEQEGPILLMTGHKSKGLEFDTVFFLDEELIRMEEPQDQNLKYVIQTRAKKELYYVKTADFYDERDNAPQDAGTGAGTENELPAIQ